MKFRKKPVVIDAVRWTGANLDEITKWAAPFPASEQTEILWTDANRAVLSIRTLEGLMAASPGDWVIRGMKGEFYPCKPDIFEMTYDSVDE